MSAWKKSLLISLLISASAGLAAQAADEFQPQDRPAATNIVLHRTESVLGKDLVSASGESAGRIVDVLTDETGKVRAVIVEFGGFLGVGSRKIAVAWSDLRFNSNRDPGAVLVDLPSERLSQAPEVRAGKPVAVVSAHGPVRDGAEAVGN